MTTNSSSIKYKTIIWDRDDNCWNLECELSGKRPEYIDDMTRAGWYIEDFEISNIKLERDGVIHLVRSTAEIPDAIDEWQISNFKENAMDYFMESWIDCQEKAADNADFEYDLSQGN